MTSSGRSYIASEDWPTVRAAAARAAENIQRVLDADTGEPNYAEEKLVRAWRALGRALDELGIPETER